MEERLITGICKNKDSGLGREKKLEQDGSQQGPKVKND